jgi:ribokinase
VSVDLAVATPAFLDLTFVGLEGLPGAGEERYAGDLLRSPGGGAITAVAAARLGLRTALVAPLGGDLAGSFVRREVEADGVLVAGADAGRTPQTVVMPVGEECAMVTIDSGVRARPADLASLDPAAVAANLEQLGFLPDGARAYLTCGDDDARAYARRPPSGLARARALFLNAVDALVLTGAGTAEDAAAALGQAVGTVIVTQGARGAIAVVDGHATELADFDTGPVVDATGDRDLLCAAYAWADLRGADATQAIAWAQLYSRLAMTVPTATGGAVSEADLLAEGVRHGLQAPPAARADASRTI